MEFSARYAVAGLFVLAAIFAVFAFVYWLTNLDRIGETTPYRIRYSVPVSGLSRGSDILFNGIKVGKVAALNFDPADPSVTVADIEVAVRVPVRADTVAGIAYQGLTGAASVSLTGGSPDSGAPVLDAQGVPSLDADPAASRSWTDNAGRMLGRIDNLFSRNSGRFETILSGLERLVGGPDQADKEIYDLPVPEHRKINAEPVDWQLVVAEPSILLSLNTDQIQIEGADGSLAPLGGARWADNLPNLFQAEFIRAFEDAGYAQAVLRPADVFEPQYRLAVDIRSFHLSRGEPFAAKGDFIAKLLDRDGQVIAARRFREVRNAASGDDRDGIGAMRQLFAELSEQLVEWSLAELQAKSNVPRPADAIPAE